MFYPVIQNTLIASVPQAEVLSLSGDYLAPDHAYESDIAPAHENAPKGQIEANKGNINPTKAEFVAYLREVFGDRLMPHFYQLAYCESRLRQFDSTGEPITSHTQDVGILQISIPTWGEKAKELELDIYNDWRANVRMAHYVFTKQSAKAWVCVSKI